MKPGQTNAREVEPWTRTDWGRRVAALVVAVCAALGAGSARAQSVVVMVPPAVDAGSDEDAEFVIDLLSDRLRGDGYNVISPGQAASAVAALSEAPSDGEPAPHECSSVDCAVRFREFFEAEAALRLRLSNEDDGDGDGDAVRLAVTLVESDEGQWTGSALVEEAGLEAAAMHALSVARRRRAERRGPWLSVEGSPHGAEVRVDGRTVGTLPFDGRFSPGEHRVEIRSDVRSSEPRVVRLPVSSWAERRVHLTLGEGQEVLPAPAPPGVAAGEPAPEVPLERQATPIYDYVVGATMLAGGAALAIAIPSVTAARSGQCSNGAADLTSCPRVYDMDNKVWGQFAVGMALLGGGITMLAVRPIQLMLGADQRGASVGVRGRF